MKLKVTVYKRLCETDKFKINDEYATTFDFGGQKMKILSQQTPADAVTKDLTEFLPHLRFLKSTASLRKSIRK